MEPKKTWDGYRSFSYLVEGEDYQSFELAPEIGRVEPFVVPLGADDAARADRLLHESVCISLHEHGGIAPADWDDNDAYIRQGREWYGYEGLALLAASTPCSRTSSTAPRRSRRQADGSGPT